MNHKGKDINHITAVTEVQADGQRCVAAVITYDKEIDGSSVGPDTYEVEGRHITGVEVDGQQVTLRLDPHDEGAATFHAGMPWHGVPATLTEAVVQVRPRQAIRTVAGEAIAPEDVWTVSERASDPQVDAFIQMQYGNQRYNLYIPKDYDPARSYPLVQFIHDAAVCGQDPRLTLTQGVGALVWTTPEVQAEHPCFVFAPQFDGPPIVDDDWNVDPRLEEAKAALDNVVEIYSIDRSRIYTTGQSMGCMASIVLNVRYPDYFAASYLVAGQWDDRHIPQLERQHLWMICSQGDAKAFPTMNQMCVNMERAGGRIARRVMEAGLPQEEYNRIAAEIAREQPNIIYTPYKMETVADGWHSNGGEHHVCTWLTAYNIPAIREWLFAQHRELQHAG